MIKRVAAVAPDRFAMGRASVEHEDGAGPCVDRKSREHGALVVVVEMEKTIPSQNPVEGAAQQSSAHIPDNPFVIGQSRRAQPNQGW